MNAIIIREQPVEPPISKVILEMSLEEARALFDVANWASHTAATVAQMKLQNGYSWLTSATMVEVTLRRLYDVLRHKV